MFKLLPRYRNNLKEKENYFSEEESKAYIAKPDETGKLKDAAGETLHGEFVYVYRNGVLYVAPKKAEPKKTAPKKATSRKLPSQAQETSDDLTSQKPIFIHHSDLVAGKDVDLAGEMLIVAGRIVIISNASGHYRPPIEQMMKGKGLKIFRKFIEQFAPHYKRGIPIETESKEARSGTQDLCMPLLFEDHSQFDPLTGKPLGLDYYSAVDFSSSDELENIHPLNQDEIRACDRALRKLIKNSAQSDLKFTLSGTMKFLKYEQSAFELAPVPPKDLLPGSPTESLLPRSPSKNWSPRIPSKNLSPRSPSENLSPRSPSKDLSPRSPSKDLSPRSPSKDLSPRSPSKDLSPRSPSKDLSPRSPSKGLIPRSPTKDLSPRTPSKSLSPSTPKKTPPQVSSRNNHTFFAITGEVLQSPEALALPASPLKHLRPGHASPRFWGKAARSLEPGETTPAISPSSETNLKRKRDEENIGTATASPDKRPRIDKAKEPFRFSDAVYTPPRKLVFHDEGDLVYYSEEKQLDERAPLPPKIAAETDLGFAPRTLSPKRTRAEVDSEDELEKEKEAKRSRKGSSSDRVEIDVVGYSAEPSRTFTSLDETPDALPVFGFSAQNPFKNFGF